MSGSTIAVHLDDALGRDDACEPPHADTGRRRRFMDPQDLLGHTWEVVEIDGEPVTGPQPPAIEFTSDGRVVGNTGANRLMGGYEIGGDRIKVTQLATTMMGGRPDAMRTETRLVQALGAGGDAELQLVVRNDYSGNSIRLRRVANTMTAPSPAPRNAVSVEASDEPQVDENLDAPGDPTTVASEEADTSPTEPEAPVADGAPIIRGSVFYRERIAMPEGSVVTVRLLDTSRAGAAAEVIGEHVIEEPPNVPVAFEIGYEPDAIDASHSYAVAAQIAVNGQVTWRSTIHHPVLTRGAGHSAVVMVTRAS
jgi:putative lipoprotein